MKFKEILFLLLTFFWISASAQVFDDTKGNFSSSGPVYRAGFISSNKIKSIKINYQRKKDGKPMEPIADKDLLVFDREGNLTNQTQIRQNRIKTDSVKWEKRYHNHLIEEETRFDALGKYKISTSYNDTGKPIHKTITRDEIQISDESGAWAENSCVWSNASGNAYLRVAEDYNQFGLLIRRKEIYLITERFSETEYSYDEKGRIMQCTEKSLDGKLSIFQYFYTEPGELISMKMKSGTSKEEDFELLYENGLPSAFIQRDISTNIMRIGKFEYEFYP